MPDKASVPGRVQAVGVFVNLRRPWVSQYFKNWPPPSKDLRRG
jgi:hypothetical protein